MDETSNRYADGRHQITRDRPKLIIHYTREPEHMPTMEELIPEAQTDGIHIEASLSLWTPTTSTLSKVRGTRE